MRNKNALPPFLMVRSGLLNEWWATLCLIGGIGTSVAMRYSGGIDEIAYALGIACSVILIPTNAIAMEETQKKKQSMKNDIALIQREFNQYLEKENVLDFSDLVLNKKLLRILVKHIVKNNPGIYDKMIKKPETVVDRETRSAIIASYLDKDPCAATKIVNKFEPNEIDSKTYKRMQLYNQRLTDSKQKTK